MSDSAPAGWYPDPTNDGKLRWWSGTNWTERFAEPDPAPVAPTSPAPAPPPRRTRRIIAIVAAAVVVVILGVVVTLRIVETLDEQREAVEFCARWDADTGVLDEIAVAAPGADALWAAGGGPIAERETLSTLLDDLGTRVGRITTSVGFPDDRQIWSRMSDVYFDLTGNYSGDGLAAVLLGEPADSGGTGMEYIDEGPSWVDGLGTRVADHAAALEPDIISFCATR